MSNDVIITMKLESAEVVRAWERVNQGGPAAMAQEIHAAKKAVADLFGQTIKDTRTQIAGWQKLSAQGKEIAENRRAWSKGLAELERQNVSQFKKGIAESAEAQKAHDEEHAERIRQMGAAEQAEQRRKAEAIRETAAKYKQSMADAAAAQKRHDDAHTARVRQMTADAVAAEKARIDKYKQGMAEASTAQQKHDAAHLAAIQAQEAARQEETAAAEEGAQGAGDALNSVITRWVSIGTAIRLATDLVGAYRRAIEEVRRSQAEITFNLDESMRKFAAQAGLDDVGRGGAQKQLSAMATRQATGMEVVEPIARQLVSSGYSSKQVLEEGGVTEQLVATQKAAAASIKGGTEFDTRQTARGATAFLLAQGANEQGQLSPQADRAALLSNQNFAQLMRDTHALFVETNLEFDDLKEFARAAPAMARAGIDLRTQLALAAVTRETITDPGDAATSLRNTVSRMVTASAHKEKIEALKSIGLVPEDINPQRVGIQQALVNFAEALKSAKAEGKEGKQRAEIVLTKVFEERGAQGAGPLIEHHERLGMFREIAADHTGFPQAHAQVSAGPAAAKQRLETEIQAKRFGGEGTEDELIKLAIQAEAPGWQGVAAAGLFHSMRWILPQKTALERLSHLQFLTKAPEVQKTPADLERSILRRVEEAQQPAPAGAPEAAAPAPAAPAPTAEERKQFRNLINERKERARVKAKRASDLAAEKSYQQGVAQETKEQKKQEGEWKSTDVVVRREQAAVTAAQEDVQADDRRIKEIRTQMAFRQSLAALPKGVRRTSVGGTHVANAVLSGRHGRGTPGRGTVTAPRGATERQQLQQNEQQRQLLQHLKDAERTRREHQQKLLEAQEKANETLEAIRKHGGTLPRGYSMAQRPAAVIGGN